MGGGLEAAYPVYVVGGGRTQVSMGACIEIQWVPSHIDIFGIEHAAN